MGERIDYLNDPDAPKAADASFDAPAHPALPRPPRPALPRLIREHLPNPPGSRKDLRRSPLHEPRDLVIWTVPSADLHQPVSRPYIVAVGTGGHVAVQQRIGQRRIGTRGTPPPARRQVPGRLLQCKRMSDELQGSRPARLSLGGAGIEPHPADGSPSPPVQGRSRCHAARPPLPSPQAALAA
jgi:hypothetical protein